jgi:DNA-binding SARP family transcriptional activator
MEGLAVSRQLVVQVLSKFSAQRAQDPGSEAVIAELSALLSAQANPLLLRVTCLGSFRIGSHKQAGLQPKRGRELLQYLTLHPTRGIARDRLIELFWPDLDARAATHRLHLVASGARRFLKEILGGFDAIRCTREGYAWHPSVCVVSDLTHFTDLYRLGSMTAFKQAVAIYSGELFEGENRDWLQPERVKYSIIHASMLERLANCALAESDHEAALGYGLELLAMDRAHEGASRLVMRCFGALGQRGRAIAEYEALRRYLKQHLGIEPMAETQRVLHSIIRESCASTESALAAKIR